MIPTSNHNLSVHLSVLATVVYLLIPTSNHNKYYFCIVWYLLYIFWFLHQTTTTIRNSLISCGCISFDSYIKPQPYLHKQAAFSVVYLLIPTSNHNIRWAISIAIMLYIFWFLHQTTTVRSVNISWYSCISFDSYIKPQLASDKKHQDIVVYLLIPTSNHNLMACDTSCMPVVYLLIPTSNHNCTFSRTNLGVVVYLLIPTSNHN